MKRVLLKIVAVCVVALGITSCKKAPIKDCFISTGSQWTETRSVPGFQQIVVNDNINVFISMGAQEQVQIEGGKNLTPNIKTSVSNGILTLNNNNICDWLRSYKKSVINVYLTMPVITSIINNGIGNIQSNDTITADSLQLQSISAGNMNLAVHSNHLTAFLFNSSEATLTGVSQSFECNFFAGTGFLYADNLKTSYVYLSSSTTGDCYVNSSGELDVVLNQIGNIYYAGNPNTVHSKINGTGKLIKE